MDELAISEAQLKASISDYLQFLQNLGRLIFLRLNAGSFILTDKDGNFRRRVQGAKAGTADYIVILKVLIPAYPTHVAVEALRVIFLELKSTKGRQTPEQKEFQEMVEAQGCGYRIIRSLEELQEIIPITERRLE